MVRSVRNMTLDARWLTFMPAYEHTVGVCTHVLSAFAVYLMITKTPKHAKEFRKYLMFLQVQS